MQPVVRAAAAVAVVAALSAAQPPQGREASSRALALPQEPGLPSLCPPGTLPDARVCVPFPRQSAGSERDHAQNRHRDRSGAHRQYDHIPRQPERPADYLKYRYPIAPPASGSFVMSGYDLDRPEVDQRHTANREVGHGGIDLAQSRGTEVRVTDLDNQVGDAEVVYVGEVFGNSVVTRHALREGSRLRDYIVIHGHLEGTGAGLEPGRNVSAGSLVGFVGDSGSPGIVHLHLEVRRVRDHVELQKLGAQKLIQNAYTVACDPRNVLPLLP